MKRPRCVVLLFRKPWCSLSVGVLRNQITRYLSLWILRSFLICAKGIAKWHTRWTWMYHLVYISTYVFVCCVLLQISFSYIFIQVQKPCITKGSFAQVSPQLGHFFMSQKPTETAPPPPQDFGSSGQAGTPQRRGSSTPPVSTEVAVSDLRDFLWSCFGDPKMFVSKKLNKKLKPKTNEGFLEMKWQRSMLCTSNDLLEGGF